LCRWSFSPEPTATAKNVSSDLVFAVAVGSGLKEGGNGIAFAEKSFILGEPDTDWVLKEMTVGQSVGPCQEDATRRVRWTQEGRLRKKIDQNILSWMWKDLYFGHDTVVFRQ
jgi:hypothetical protein